MTKAVKYEIKNPSTCRATLLGCKFSSMFPVFHLACSTWSATQTFVAGWRKLLRKVERVATLRQQIFALLLVFIKLTTCRHAYIRGSGWRTRTWRTFRRQNIFPKAILLQRLKRWILYWVKRLTMKKAGAHCKAERILMPLGDEPARLIKPIKKTKEKAMQELSEIFNLERDSLRSLIHGLKSGLNRELKREAEGKFFHAPNSMKEDIVKSTKVGRVS